MKLTPTQRALLAVIDRLGSGAYGVPIRRAWAAEVGWWRASPGHLYAELDRLEAAGLIRSQREPGGPERGGRDKLYWWLSGEGKRMLGGGEL